MSNKKTNEVLKKSLFAIADASGEQLACKSCTKSYCCEFQVEIGVSSKEFDSIEHLVTPTHITRAKEELSKTTIWGDRITYRCPFLSEDGKCEIYDERFMICAMYGTSGTPEACSSDNWDDGIWIINLEPMITLATKDPDTLKRFESNMLGKESDVLKEFQIRYKLKDER